MRFAGNLRRHLLQRRLARREDGPELLALVAGETVVPPPAARSALAEYIARGAWLQGDVARRIDSLFVAGREEAGNFLLAAALEGAPDSHLFVGARLNRLAALGRSDDARDYARQLLEREAIGLPLLQRLIAGFHRAGVAEGDPLLGEAWRRWRDVPASPVERGLAEGRLYRALGMTGAARWRLRAARDAARHGRDRADVEQALADLADARDRWLEAPPAGRRTALEARAGLAERFGRSPLVSDTGPLFPADLAGEPLANAFDWLLDGETGDHAEYRPRDRLLLVGNTLGCGGMERILAQTYRHFADSDAFADVDLALIGFEAGGEDGFYAGLAGVDERDVVLLDRSCAPDFPFALLPGSWKARCQKLFDHVRDTRPRVIHAWNDLTGLLAAFAGLRAGCPRIVVHFHHGPAMPLANPAEQLAAYPHAYRALAARPELRFLFCAEAAARGYARWWELTVSDTFRTVYNGIDWPGQPGRAAARAALGLPEDAPVIGTVMSFKQLKQPLLWADAALKLAEAVPQAHFLMVGEGPLREAVAERFAGAGKGDRLRLPGQVVDVAAHYAAMDLFWLTSTTEGLPNVCVEAQLAGVPVAAFAVGGTAETFIDGESGIAVQPGDAAALVEASRALLADPERRAAMSGRAAAQARARFSPTGFFAALQEAYDA